MMKRLFIFSVLAVVFYNSDLAASKTRVWELAGFDELSRGELVGTQLTSKGEVIRGYLAQEVDIPAIGMSWAAAKDSKGNIYLGTGYDGKIFRIEGNKAIEIAQTSAIVITDMLFDNDDNLYISSLPDATIFKLEKPLNIKNSKKQELKEFASLPEEAEHIWSLALDEKGTIYAATGPNGQIYAIGRDGKPHLLADTSQTHILSLTVSKQGTLYAGTSPDALLYRIEGPGRVFTVADFDAAEVKKIQMDSEGNIIAAVNQFQTTQPAATKTESKIAPKTAVQARPPKPKGEGFLFVVKQNGSFEQVWNQSNTHVTSLAVSADGKKWIGLGSEGKVVCVDSDRTVFAALNLNEREVSALLANVDLFFVGTGDAGAAYNISKEPLDSYYISPVLDAGGVSEWGRSRWFITGTVEVSARSGNTRTPDDSWTNWSKPFSNGSKPPVEPAKFLQYRFELKSAKASFLNLELSFKPENQRATIESFDPSTPFTDTAKSVKPENLSRRWVNPLESKRTSILDLTWKVNNPDDDRLRYRLYFRPVGKKMWLPIFRDDYIHTLTRYSWDTSSIPEGRYQLKLEVDDSIDNPDNPLVDTYISVPVDVDNHPPVITKLAFKNNTIIGEATDSFSPISAFLYSIDAGPFSSMPCKDGIFDSTTEEFSYKLPEPLEPGPHVIRVMAIDRAGNRVTREQHVEIPR